MIADRLAWPLALTFAAGLLVYWLSPVLTPFLAAALLAYMFNPLVGWLARVRVPRVFGAALVLVVLIGAMVLLVSWLLPRLRDSLSALVTAIPSHLVWLQDTLLPRLRDYFGLEIEAVDAQMLRAQIESHWREIANAAATVFSAASRSGGQVALWLVNLLLIPVVMFYLLRDWPRLLARVQGLLPPRYRSKIAGIAREIDDVLAAFLRGQLIVMAVLASVYATGLWLVGLDLALPIGLVAGVVSFVPYLGVITGLVMAGLAALFQFQEPMMLVWVVLVFGVGQLLEGMVLTPLLIGERIGLHPVAVIFAVLAGGQLFGFFGVLLALPAAAAIVVALRHLHGSYTRSDFYTQAARRRKK